tara:strand:+ start:360 stop:581 length:222 start_codon:yes stop_codon:yes gene_type:complete
VNIKERASQASLILGNPIIEEMWETLEKDHIVNWLNTTDYTEQESYWYKINALRSVKEYLESLVDADKIENKE